jgi:hypothetical protein
MKFYNTFALVIYSLFIISEASSQDNIPESRNQYSFTIYLHRDSIPNLNGKPEAGTGLIAKHNSKLYLITAAHVSRFMDSKSYIKICDENNETTTYYLKDLCTNGIVQWKYHSIADMAILPLDLSNKNCEKIKKKSIVTTNFILLKNAISYGTKLKIIGFPLMWGSKRIFRPFIWEAYSLNNIFESPTLFENKMCDFIYINPCLQRGNSGGPAIISTPEKNTEITVVGIAHGSVWDNSRQGRPILDLITPIYYFFDLVEK